MLDKQSWFGKSTKYIQVFGSVGDEQKTKLLLALGKYFPPFFEDKVTPVNPAATFQSDYMFTGFPKKSEVGGSFPEETNDKDLETSDLEHSFSLDFGDTFHHSQTKSIFAYLDGGRGHSEDEDLRNILLHERKSHLEETVLLISHMESVSKTAGHHIDKGRHVISSFSTAAIFAYMYGCEHQAMIGSGDWFNERVKNLKPDPTFYVLLLVPPAIASEKIQAEIKNNSLYKKSDYQRFDVPFFERLNKGYFDFLQRYRRPRVIVHDASKPVETFIGIVEEGIKKHLIQS